MLYVLNAKTLFLLLLGLSFGSFANVYFFRIQKNLSLLKPRSFCPCCGHTIPWYDNIPVLSYFLLKGKCRSCQSEISIRYPLTETLCGILFFLVGSKFQSTAPPMLIAFLTFSFILFLIAGIDLYTYLQSDKEYGIIPDHLNWILILTGLMFSPFNLILYFPFDSFFFSTLSLPLTSILSKGWVLKISNSLLGGVMGGVLMILVRKIGEKIFKKESLGLGDVKMIIAIGFWLGIKGTLLTLILGSTFGSLIGIFLILRKFIGRHTAIPFGPFLSIGALSSLFYLL